MCPDRKILVNFSEKSEILSKIGKSGKIGKKYKILKFFYWNTFIFLKWTFCENFMRKYWFLTKLEHFIYFSNFTRIWPASQNYLVRSLFQKISKKKSRRAKYLKFSQNVSNMISLKVRKIEAPTAPQNFFIARYMEGGVNLPNPPRNRVNPIKGGSENTLLRGGVGKFAYPT